MDFIVVESEDIFGDVDEIYVANKAKLKSFFSFASTDAMRFHHIQLLLEERMSVSSLSNTKCLTFSHT